MLENISKIFWVKLRFIAKTNQKGVMSKFRLIDMLLIWKMIVSFKIKSAANAQILSVIKVKYKFIRKLIVKDVKLNVLIVR